VGGGTVYALYQINVGPAFVQPLVGWGAGAWGAGPWGIGEASTDALRLWSQNNFGEDLVFGPRGGLSTTGMRLRVLPRQRFLPLLLVQQSLPLPCPT